MRLKAKFIYLPGPGDRTLQISVTEADTRPLQELTMEKLWTPFTTQPFEIRSPEFTLNFECPQEPAHLPSSDPRMLAFLIKDLTVEPVN